MKPHRHLQRIVWGAVILLVWFLDRLCATPDRSRSLDLLDTRTTQPAAKWRQSPLLVCCQPAVQKREQNRLPAW
ncbi:MAG: hypothetical protein DYG89_24585 [Caldilinea sp. CFX5]|nr:hypothetical protein [Caldilinea sp. CFX5]